MSVLDAGNGRRRSITKNIMMSRTLWSRSSREFAGIGSHVMHEIPAMAKTNPFLPLLGSDNGKKQNWDDC